MEALQKENREYKREVGKMRQELDELLRARSDAKSSVGVGCQKPMSTD